jgi:hypothetical protein
MFAPTTNALMKSASSFHPLSLWIVLLIALAADDHSASAQTNAADRARLLQNQAPLQTPGNVSAEGVYQNYAVDGPTDADLGEQEI